LVKVWDLRDKVSDQAAGQPAYLGLLQRTIAKVTGDIAEFKLNTVVSSLMILVNKMQEADSVRREDYGVLLQLLAPLAPHISEELWAAIGERESIFHSCWPEADARLAAEEEVTIAVQVNGKRRAELQVATSDVSDQSKVLAAALVLDQVKKYTDHGEVVKKIYVPGRIVNLVVK